MEPSRNSQRRRAAQRRIAARRRRAALKLLCGVLFLILVLILGAAVMLLLKGGDAPAETQGTDAPTQSTTLPAGDTTPPTAEPVDTVIRDGKLPDPAALVTNIRDEGEVAVTWMRQPDVTQSGETTALVRLTDEAGNTSVVEVKLTVIVDQEPPVIEGAVDLEFYVGDPIA